LRHWLLPLALLSWTGGGRVDDPDRVRVVRNADGARAIRNADIDRVRNESEVL
jgi:hypothetical protein